MLSFPKTTKFIRLILRLCPKDMNLDLVIAHFLVSFLAKHITTLFFFEKVNKMYIKRTPRGCHSFTKGANTKILCP